MVSFDAFPFPDRRPDSLLQISGADLQAYPAPAPDAAASPSPVEVQDKYTEEHALIDNVVPEIGTKQHVEAIGTEPELVAKITHETTDAPRSPVIPQEMSFDDAAFLSLDYDIAQGKRGVTDVSIPEQKQSEKPEPAAELTAAADKGQEVIAAPEVVPQKVGSLALHDAVEANTREAAKETEAGASTPDESTLVKSDARQSADIEADKPQAPGPEQGAEIKDVDHIPVIQESKQPPDNAETGNTADHADESKDEQGDNRENNDEPAAGDSAGGGDGPRDGDPPDGPQEDDPYRHEYEKFRPAVDRLKSEVAALPDPSEHPDFVGKFGNEADDESGNLAFRIGDPDDQSGEKKYQIRFTPEGDEPAHAELRAREQARHEALVRAAAIDDPDVRQNMEQLVAHDSQEGHTITTHMPGVRLSELSTEDKRAVTAESLDKLLTTSEAMVEHGVMPDDDAGRSVVLDPENGKLRFTDMQPIENTDADPDHPVYAVAGVYDRVVSQLTPLKKSDRSNPTEAVSARIGDLSQRALRDHYLYRKPHLATLPEDLSAEEIRMLYARTSPNRPGPNRTESKRTTYDAHVASELLDLSLSRSSGDLTDRLAQLEEAHNAYEEVVYRRTILNMQGEIGRRLRTNSAGRNLLLRQDSFLQARLALAAWPAMEARVRGETLATEQREQINHNFATVLDEMLPEGGFDITAILENKPPFERFKPLGPITEVVAMTALSRQSSDADSALATPTSEIRRLYAGPDAAILFRDEAGDHEYDIDWKLMNGGGADEIKVGQVCYQASEQLTKRPYGEDESRTSKIFRSVAYGAELLRDEGTGARTLSPDEKRFLDSIQNGLWNVISEKAQINCDISDLRGRAIL